MEMMIVRLLQSLLLWGMVFRKRSQWLILDLGSRVSQQSLARGVGWLGF